MKKFLVSLVAVGAIIPMLALAAGNGQPSCSLSFYLNPSTPYPKTVVVSWTTKNAEVATFTPDIGSGGALSGSVSYTASGPTDYILTVSNGGNKTSSCHQYIR